MVGRTRGDRTSRSGAAAARDAGGMAIRGHNHPDAAALRRRSDNGRRTYSRLPPSASRRDEPQRAGPPLRRIRRGPGYPHLANYNGLDDGRQVPFFAADDLFIARRGAPLRQLARANPRALTLLYERTLQVDLCCVRDLYGLDPAAVPPGWWLTQAGSRLTEPINAAQQWIPVADPRPFAPCQDVLVDGESMHVWAISGHRLNVLRGYNSAAVLHRAGARIAAHYSYRRDLSNCHLSGPQADPRPWSFNLSSHCPRWHGQTWADYLAHRVARLVRRQGWRGIFYDNLSDLPPSALVDVDHDGHADGGVLHGINVWRAGERALLAETRRLLPGRPILVNGDLLIGGLAQGREMEGFPLIPGAALSTAIDAYLYDNASGAPLSIVNADSNAHPQPSVPSAQLAVGAALLGDGYVSYDYGWLAHGSPWWFDAYDGGEGSAIRGPVDATTTLLPVVHPQRFRPGAVVLLDWEAARVRRVLPRALLVQRGVWGTIPTRHAARTAVTTTVQRAAGHGYLGWPLGPASLVPTARWAVYRLPFRLQRGRAPTAVHPRRAGVHLLRPTTVLRLFSTGHYYPDVARLTLLAPRARGALRTLVFSARGPAGQALWVYDGHTAAPVVLRPYWHRYVVPIDGAGRIMLGAGRVRGRVAITGVRLISVQAFVWRRDFTRGAVIVNSTDAMQRVSLGRPYRVLAGDQDPAATTGRLTCALAIAPYRAAILLNAAPGTRCPRAMSRAQRQARQRGRGATTPVPHVAPRPSTAHSPTPPG